MPAKYKITKDIPITHNVHPGGPGKKYPFEEMEVGDSFLIPCTKAKSLSVASTVMGSARRVNNIMKFTTKYVPEEHGRRVWRIS